MISSLTILDKRPPIAYEVLRQRFLKIGVTHISYLEKELKTEIISLVEIVEIANGDK